MLAGRATRLHIAFARVPLKTRQRLVEETCIIAAVEHDLIAERDQRAGIRHLRGG